MLFYLCFGKYLAVSFAVVAIEVESAIKFFQFSFPWAKIYFWMLLLAKSRFIQWFSSRFFLWQSPAKSACCLGVFHIFLEIFFRRGGNSLSLCYDDGGELHLSIFRKLDSSSITGIETVLWKFFSFCFLFSYRCQRKTALGQQASDMHTTPHWSNWKGIVCKKHCKSCSNKNV